MWTTFFNMLLKFLDIAPDGLMAVAVIAVLSLSQIPIKSSGQTAKTPEHNHPRDSNTAPITADTNTPSQQRIPAVKGQLDANIADLESYSNSQKAPQEPPEQGPSVRKGDVPPQKDGPLIWFKKYRAIITGILSTSVVAALVKYLRIIPRCMAAVKKDFAERAHMETVGIRERRQDAQSPFEIIATWRNHGKRPATITGVSVKCCVVGSSDPLPAFDEAMTRVGQKKIVSGNSFSHSSGMRPINESHRIFKHEVLRGICYLTYYDRIKWISRIEEKRFTGKARDLLHVRNTVRTEDGGISLLDISFDD